MLSSPMKDSRRVELAHSGATTCRQGSLPGGQAPVRRVLVDGLGQIAREPRQNVIARKPCLLS